MTAARKPDGWRNNVGELSIWAAFRCSCGRISAMADQVDNGNAAMVHTTPRCERFEALTDQRAALQYFRSLPPLELTPELVQQIARETVHC